jgi:hypothetical protein
LRQQSRHAVALEHGRGLVEGGPRQAEQAGGLGLGDAFLLCVSKHLVLHLHQVVGVEEPTSLEPCSAYPLRLGVEHAGLAQTFDLCDGLGQFARRLRLIFLAGALSA